MSRKRFSDDPGPFSIRLPHDMREDLEALARAQYRSLHSLILEILADALLARRKEQEESENVANVVPRSPTP